MTTMNIHIDEKLNGWGIKALKESLNAVPYVFDVELKISEPHVVIVEYEEHHNVPVTVLEKLSNQGLHSDIQAC